MLIGTVRRWGNSKVVTIPSDIAKVKGLEVGTRVEIVDEGPRALGIRRVDAEEGVS
jgi:antitoxin component of MazEF toxin-antitoxin module